MNNQRAFTKFASSVAHFTGSPAVIGISIFTVVAWLLSGPVFHYSDTWQLVMNTWTNVVTFLMVFLIQNSQNRDGAAIQLKLDELIRVGQARNLLVGVEKLDEAEIKQLKEQLEARAARE